MTSATQALIDRGLDHLGRFSFFTRDNPYVSSRAALSLSGRHRQILAAILEGELTADEWLNSVEANVLRNQIRVGCLPRDVQVIIRDGRPVVGVESVHAFLNAPLFWWLVSVLWCLTAGRLLDAALGGEIMGYRLHPGFVEQPESTGIMFRDRHSSYEQWKRFASVASDDFPGEVLAANTVDIRDFYYSARALPSQTVDTFLAVASARQALSQRDIALTELLDALHIRFAGRCQELGPRGTTAGIAHARPLPVGLPSSQILANMIMSTALRDLLSRDGIDGAAAYADDVVIVTRSLPEVGEATRAYLSRLGIVPAEGAAIFESQTAASLARLEVRLEKSATSYSKSAAAESTPSEIQDAELDEFDPYVEGDPSPDWGGGLRTVLRAPFRRDRVPRELAKGVRRLVDEIRVGLDPDETRESLERLVSDMDSGTFLALRPYWTELLVASVVGEGLTAIASLTNHFEAVAKSLEPPPGSGSALKGGLRRGLRDSWVHALAQAVAVSTSAEERRELAASDEVLFQDSAEIAIRSVMHYADRLRRRRLIPASLVSAPLAEFTGWPGRLIGVGAFEDFVAWSSSGGADTSVPALSDAVSQAVRFIPLHEICLAIHLWAAPDVSDWVATVFQLFSAQPLLQRDLIADLRGRVDGVLNSNSPVEDLPDDVCLRFAMPSIKVRQNQLDALLADDLASLGEIARHARQSTQRVVWAATSRGADVLVLAEWAVLPQQLPWVMAQAASSQMLVVGGQSPSVTGTTYANRLWTGIPLTDEVGHRACLVPPPRQKRILSPHEMALISQAGLSPAPSTSPPAIYTWRGLTFSSLICFEFADIAARQQLRSRADLLTVSSLNMDWRYFDAIQEATTRDNYCLTVCVNTGAFPGTRIMRPTRSEMAVAASVHGSDDPTIVTRVIDMLPIVAARLRGLHPREVLTDSPGDDTELGDYKPLPPR